MVSTGFTSAKLVKIRRQCRLRPNDGG